MYQPFCSRSGRNSSSLSLPARWRSSWSRYCAARLLTNCLSNSVYWYMFLALQGDQPGAGIGQQQGQQGTDQSVGRVAHQARTQPDTGQRTCQQSAQQRPVDRTDGGVAQPSHQLQRNGVG